MNKSQPRRQAWKPQNQTTIDQALVWIYSDGCYRMHISDTANTIWTSDLGTDTCWTPSHLTRSDDVTVSGEETKLQWEFRWLARSLNSCQWGVADCLTIEDDVVFRFPCNFSELNWWFLGSSRTFSDLFRIPNYYGILMWTNIGAHFIMITYDTI